MLEHEIENLGEEIEATKKDASSLGAEIGGTQNELNQLTEQINQLLRQQDHEELSLLDASWVIEFQENLEQQIEVPEILTQAECLPKLSQEDIIAGCICGLIAAVADIFLVGTPQIKDGVLTGAPISEILRKIDGNSGIFKLLSRRCRVPYDLSAKKDILYPGNHRLRNPGHDPLFGSLFALLDIVMGTTTCINDAGQLVMIPNPKGIRNGWLFLLYYFGHLVSDAFTYCGLPAPGWFLTQFFASENEKSLARAAEKMYQNGFDMRQGLGMLTSAQIGTQLIRWYSTLAYPEQNDGFGAEAEIQQMQRQLRQRELRLLTSGVAVSGNVLKIMLPPVSGNVAGINLIQWQDFAWNGLQTVRTAGRDMSTENVVHHRKEIDRQWNTLLEDSSGEE